MENKYFVVNQEVLNRELKFLKDNGFTAYDNVKCFLDNVLEDDNKDYIIIDKNVSYAKQVQDIIDQQERKIIVAFIGRAGSGKDYQCSILQEHGYKKLAFADALRDVAFSSLGIPVPFGMARYDEMKSNDECIKVVTEDSYHHLSFRKFLELLGTQGIRKYDNNFWANALVKQIKDNKYNKICISDMRFINEYNAVSQFCEDNDYEFQVRFCDYHSDRYQKDNDHQSAWMGNYFATHGYNDLDIIESSDMDKYKIYECERLSEKFSKVELSV